jgi:DNA-binding NtrC family response regulator
MARILIVEDDIAVREALDVALSCEGHLVETVADAERAQQRIQTPGEEYDVIVTDMRMEREDSGLAVVKTAQEKAPLTPVIVLTGYAGIEDSIKSMEAGAFSYLAKRGEDREYDLLLIHVQRAIGLRLTSGTFFDALDRALDVLIPVLESLKTVTAQLKSLADARNRLLRHLTRGETDVRGDAEV